MSTSSIAVEQNKIRRRVTTDGRKDVVQEKKPQETNKIKLLIQYLYRDILDVIKSILIIGAFLAIYKATGLYDWWMQFVGNIT